MATKTWYGRASGSRHRKDFTPASAAAAGTRWWFTVGGVRAGPQVVSDGTLATLLTDLAAAYAAAGAEWQEMTYDASATKIVVYGPSDGRDPEIDLTESTGGVAISTSEPAVGTGPSHWDNAENWLEGSVPAAADDLVFRGGAAPKYGLPGTGTTFGSVTFTPESAGAGLPEQNPAGYAEYLSDRRLELNHTGAVLVQTAALVRLKSSAGAARTFTVAGPQTAVGGLDLVTDNFAHVLAVSSGRAVVADGSDPAGGNEAATLTSATVSSDASAWLVVGAGTTLTTLTQNGGTVQLRAAAATVNHNAGDMSRSGTGAVTTWADGGGRAYDYGTGTVTTLTAAGSYSYVGASGCTVTTLNGKPNGRFVDRSGKVTVTNPVVFDRCHLPGPPGDAGPAPFYLSAGTGRAVTLA